MTSKADSYYYLTRSFFSKGRLWAAFDRYIVLDLLVGIPFLLPVMSWKFCNQKTRKDMLYIDFLLAVVETLGSYLSQLLVSKIRSAKTLCKHAWPFLFICIQ